MPAQPDSDGVFSLLTVEDARILTWVALNKTQPQIAELLGLSRSMVKHRVSRLEDLVGVDTMRQLGPWWLGRRDEWIGWVQRQTALTQWRM